MPTVHTQRCFTRHSDASDHGSIQRTRQDLALCRQKHCQAAGERGSWADCVAIYNRLASRPRTQDGLCNAYRSLDEAEMESGSRAAEWEAIREQVKEWLQRFC